MKSPTMIIITLLTLTSSVNIQAVSTALTESYDSGADGIAEVTLRNTQCQMENCCVGTRGNANGDPEEKVIIADVTYLINYSFGVLTGPAPPSCALAKFSESALLSQLRMLGE